MKSTTVHYIDLADAAKELGIPKADAEAAIQSGKWQSYGLHQYRLINTPESDPYYGSMAVTGAISYHTNEAA